MPKRLAVGSRTLKTKQIGKYRQMANSVGSSRVVGSSMQAIRPSSGPSHTPLWANVYRSKRMPAWVEGQGALGFRACIASKRFMGNIATPHKWQNSFVSGIVYPLSPQHQNWDFLNIVNELMTGRKSMLAKPPACF